MRFAIPCVVLMASASWGVSVSAQAITFGRRPFPPAEPSFQIQGFISSSISSLRLNGAPLRRIKVASSEATVFLGMPLYTCPMPVAHTDSGKGDPMPVVRGGTPEPMPVAKSGCWNPLDPSH